MKIVVIGDIHGRGCWTDIIKKENTHDDDLVLFEGDYVSTHENISESEQIENLEEILSFKEQYWDNVILLRGNHDLQHMGYDWGGCSGYFPVVAAKLGYTDLKEKFLEFTQWLYVEPSMGIVFSHAGISNTWFESLGVKNLDDINKMEPSEIFGFTPDNPYDHYGDSKTQPLTWIRPRALYSDMYTGGGNIQIVGHTTMYTGVTKVDCKGGSELWLCDCLPYEYIVVDLDEKKILTRMLDENTIRLPNRYGYTIFLKKMDDGKWIMSGKGKAINEINHHMRMIMDPESKAITAIDPPGGPMISVGDVMKGKTVKFIENTEFGIVLTLE